MTPDSEETPNAAPVRSGALLGVRVLDAGHRYELNSLDGEYPQVLQFVKRHDAENPQRFPGNTSSNPGTTLQMVLRTLLDRVGYLQRQIWCPENWLITKLLQVTIWILEARAARRHGKGYWHGLAYASESPICRECGHTQCEHASTPNAELRGRHVQSGTGFHGRNDP